MQFKDSMIYDAFKLLISKTSHDKYKFCFLIDGLDEYDSATVAHWDLARSL